jgi:hypothetical protein
MNPADTPRTDEHFSKKLSSSADKIFTQKLERELNSARNEIARLYGQTSYACACGGMKLEAQERDEFRERLLKEQKLAVELYAERNDFRACAEELAQYLEACPSCTTPFGTSKAIARFNELKSK